MPDKSVKKAVKDILWQTINPMGSLVGASSRAMRKAAQLTSKKPAPKVSTTKNFQVKRSGKNVGATMRPIR